MTLQDFVICIVFGVPSSIGMLYVSYLDFRGKL